MYVALDALDALDQKSIHILTKSLNHYKHQGYNDGSLQYLTKEEAHTEKKMKHLQVPFILFPFRHENTFLKRNERRNGRQDCQSLYSWLFTTTGFLRSLFRLQDFTLKVLIWVSWRVKWLENLAANTTWANLEVELYGCGWKYELSIQWVVKVGICCGDQ